MSTATTEREHELWYRRLYIPTYPVVDAARYTGAKTGTINRWYYGEKPILSDREKKKPLNYMQLIETAFVAFFRKLHVPMWRIRESKDYIAQNFGKEYPFVQYKFKTEGYHILMEYLKFEPSPELNKVIVTDEHGQLAWDSIIGDKFAQFEYEYELAMRWHPVGTESAVIVDPRIAFGTPMVNSVPTWALKGRWIANETIEEIIDDFGLDEKSVRDGLKFEGIKLNGHSVLG